MSNSDHMELHSKSEMPTHASISITTPTTPGKEPNIRESNSKINRNIDRLLSHTKKKRWSSIYKPMNLMYLTDPKKKLKCDQTMPNFISSPIISITVNQNRNNQKSPPWLTPKRTPNAIKQCKNPYFRVSPITSIIIKQNRNNHTTYFSTPEHMLEYPNDSTKSIDPFANG